jgi:hypothetical protein
VHLVDCYRQRRLWLTALDVLNVVLLLLCAPVCTIFNPNFGGAEDKQQMQAATGLCFFNEVILR